MRLFAALLFSVLLSSPAFAEDYFGALVSAPATVKVLTDEGTTAEYSITAILNTVAVHPGYKMISLTNNGISAMCGDYLGQLAEDFTVTLDAGKGVRKTATIRAASGKDRKVNVFGMCQGDSNVLTQLSMNVSKGEDGLEIR
jgi:hypothetical protein